MLPHYHAAGGSPMISMGLMGPIETGSRWRTASNAVVVVQRIYRRRKACRGRLVFSTMRDESGGGGASSAGPGPHAPSSPSLPPPPPPQRHVLRSIGRPSGRKTHHGVSGSRARIWRAEPLRGVAGPFRHGGVQTRARRLPFSSTRVPVDPSPQCIFFPPPPLPPSRAHATLAFVFFISRGGATQSPANRRGRAF